MLVVGIQTKDTVEVVLMDCISSEHRASFYTTLNSLEGSMDQSHVLDVGEIQVWSDSRYTLHIFQTASYKSLACVYEEGQLLWSINVASPKAAAFLSQDRIILHRHDKTLLVVNCQTGETTSTLGEHQGPLACVAISVSGSVFLGFEDPPAICVLKDGIPDMPEITVNISTVQGEFHVACLSQDGDYLALGMMDASIQLWVSPECREALDNEWWQDEVQSEHESENESEDSENISNGSDSENGGYSDSETSEYYPDRWQLVTRLGGHFGEVMNLAFHSCGKQIVSSSTDNTIRIWDITAIVEGLEWDIEVEDGVMVEGSWFRHAICLGGWLTGYHPPEPFIFNYPFNLPDGVKVLDWKIEPRRDQS